MGEIIQQADGQSVADNLGASSDAATQLSGARLPLHERLLTGLRFLLKENQIPLNRNGAAAWFDGEQLWVVSKRGIDALREHLTQEGHAGIPTRNDRIFDELQQHKVLTPNGDRSIWKVAVSGEDWSHTLTCLCFPASRIWPDTHSRPDIFNGSIVPTSSDAEPETSSTTKPQTATIASAPSTTNERESNHIESDSTTKPDTEAGFDPIAFFSESQTGNQALESDSTEIHPAPDLSCASLTLKEDEDPGKQFRAWLR